jgi:hypothetical protein
MEDVVAPPRLARGLLLLSLPASERESIPGDLEEEFAILLASGTSVAAARAWYWRQARRSAAPLLGTCWRRAEIQENVVVVLLAFAAPLRVLDLLWAFVLSQVPLKVDAIRPVEFLALSLTAACILGLACGAMRRRIAPWVGLTALACLVTIPARLPLWYWVLLPFTAAVSAALVNRRKEAA